MQRFVLTLSCPDRMGIVAAVATFLQEHRCNIAESAQFGDPASGEFFMRVCFDDESSHSADHFRTQFAPVGERFAMQWAVHDAAAKSRVILMVSKEGHCLNDLLYRHRIGAMPIEVCAIVSNHRDFYQLAAAHDIPFHHLPVTTDTKAKQEERLLDIFHAERCDFIVLARYMQILSQHLCETLQEKVINIHHSFLPSFQGAKPYKQAHDRGVKLIGATAHFVTADLDEGPIIEQDVARVEHGMSAEDCAAVGRDVECAVLARAVKWRAEHRVLLNGHRTVIFK
jgi:formyltetrahydrofolate deformylase